MTHMIWVISDLLSGPDEVETMKGGTRKPIARPNKSPVDPIAVAIDISSVLNHLFAKTAALLIINDQDSCEIIWPRYTNQNKSGRKPQFLRT